MIQRSQIFINGQWVDSAGDDVIPVINPATEEVIASVPRGSAKDVDRAVHAAAAAFPDWSESTVAQRATIFTRAAELMQARFDEINTTIVSEVGQPAAAAAKSQTAGSVEDLKILAECLGDVSWGELVGNTFVRREPAGVVAAITPWNSPMHQICIKAGAAIAAGCTVVLKGTEVAPQSSFIFTEIMAEAGVPDGVLNLVSGTGPEVGEAMAGHDLVDLVSLTGSVRAGSRVMEIASRSIKRVALELGGKSANIIFDDADLVSAVGDGIDDAFRNSGQVCGGLSRMLVPAALLAQAEAAAVQKADSFVLGDPFDPATTLGPVTSAIQRDRVRGYIRSGIEDGVRLLTGGPEAPEGLDHGYFVRPTIFSGDNSTRLAREEIFGPVVVIIPFEGEHDALAIANDSPYGLAAGVWSADTDRAQRVARKLRVGRVRVNGAPLNKWAPHGGFKMSGIGREWGRFGIEEFLEYKSVIG